MKFGIRTPSLKKRIAARTSWKRYVRHSLGFKAPRGWGWLTNPKRAAYNRVYNRTSVSVDRLFKGGRRRGARHDGAALLFVVGLVVVAAFGVYLLAAGAILFIAWLVRVATKKPSASSGGRDAAIPAAPPGNEYSPIATVDGAVFDDPIRAKQAAHAVLGAWLQQVPKAPRRPADLIRAVEIRRRLVGRLTTDLEGRRFVWRSRPAPGRQALGAPPMQPEALDPWNPPTDLKTSSRYVATCWTCDGNGRVDCPMCSGSARLTCSDCGGGGKYYGTTANGAQRLLNCKGCRGKGTVTCGMCVRGAVDCSTCAKAKKLECWLEIDESCRQDVQVEPDGEVTKAFPWGRDGVIASAEQIALDARVVDAVHSLRPLELHELPPSIPEDWKRDCWSRIQPSVQPGERVRSQTLTLLEIPSTDVTYVVSGELQTVAFEGKRMLAPPPWYDVLFARRAQMLGRSKWILAALPFAAFVIYMVRGSYFVGDRAGPLVAGVVGAAATAALCVYAVLWYATLGRRAAVKWSIAAIAPIAIAAALVVLAEPTIARARAYVDAGELDAAKLELNALGARNDEQLAPLWDDVYLKEALATKTCAKAVEATNKIDPGSASRLKAITYADSLALTAAKAALDAGDLQAANTELSCASASARSSADAHRISAGIALLSSQQCVRSKNWECAIDKAREAEQLGAADESRAAKAQAMIAVRSEFDTEVSAAQHEKDVAARLAHERSALALWPLLAVGSAEVPSAVKQLNVAVTRDEQALARQQAIEQRKAEAAEKRRIAEEARQRRREEAEERQRAYRPLLCGDGSLSPSCTCGGSWRGCCSHHSGVAGCYGD